MKKLIVIIVGKLHLFINIMLLNFCSFYFICVCKFLVLNYGICVKIWKFWYIFMYLNKNVTVDAKMCFGEKKDNHACMPEVCIVRCPLFLDYSQHTIRVSASSFWLHQIHLYRGSQWGCQVWTFIKYSKTSLIQCLCNLFSCVIGHWFFIPIWPFSLWFSLCYPTPCLIPTRIRQVLLYISLKDGLFKTQYCNYNRILKKLLQETNYKIIMIA